MPCATTFAVGDAAPFRKLLRLHVDSRHISFAELSASAKLQSALGARVRSRHPNRRSLSAEIGAWSGTRGCLRDRAASANPASTAPEEPSPCPLRPRDEQPTCRPRPQGRAAPRRQRCPQNLRTARQAAKSGAAPATPHAPDPLL